jgi:hypothetical protein
MHLYNTLPTLLGDSEMAPEALEIAQNGLANGDPPVLGRRDRP